MASNWKLRAYYSAELRYQECGKFLAERRRRNIPSSYCRFIGKVCMAYFSPGDM
jgi:hypothetical protein